MQVCGLVVVLQVCMCRSAEFVDKVDESSKCVRRGSKEGDWGGRNEYIPPDGSKKSRGIPADPAGGRSCSRREFAVLSFNLHTRA